jgi:hypothetical protein
MKLSRQAVLVGTGEPATDWFDMEPNRMGLPMRLKTYKDTEKFRHFDLVLHNGVESIDLVSVFFSLFLGTGAICALIATFESSAATLSQWVH